MGGVFSRTEGFTDLVGMIPAYVFHLVCMVGGMYLLVRASALKRAAQAGPGMVKHA